MNYIPEFLRDSMAEARERLSGWRSLEDRFTGDGAIIETREYLDTPMPEPQPIPAPEYSRSVKGGSMELNWKPKPKRKSFTNFYPAKRESPTFDRRDCTVCGKSYEPTGAAQTTCGPECRRVRRTESQQRTEVRAMAGLSKQERKALRSACEHAAWYKYGPVRKMCKKCGTTRNSDEGLAARLKRANCPHLRWWENGSGYVICACCRLLRQKEAA